MMKKAKVLSLILTVQLLIVTPLLFAGDGPVEIVTPKTRCAVCGMFVAKYTDWLAQIQYGDKDHVEFFDGVKDMMVFYFNPEQYGGHPRDEITSIFVKDYYSLAWLSAKDAFYVVGSDVYGPMGHELIPFTTRDAAESFLKDHHGKQILTFDEITPELIQSLRVGQKMR